nr:MLV-related proviral Env polyprotein-like [Manis javanica]
MKGILLISALVWTFKGTTSVTSPPPQPWGLTWMLVNSATGEVISTTEHRAPLGTWWPDLFFCLRQINQGYRTLWGLGPYVPLASAQGFYACPEAGKGESCGWGPFWCARLDCGIPRHVPRDKACDQDRDWVRIQFTEKGKKTEVSRWVNGLTWGIKYYKSWGHEEEGSTLTIKLIVSAPTPSPNAAVGPNQVKIPQKPSNQNKGLGQKDKKMSTGTFTPEPIRGPGPSTSGLWAQHTPSGLDNPMWEMVQAVVETLNHTTLFLTDPCWLCYTGSPPFYEAIRITGSYTISNSHPTYWDRKPWGLMIAQVSVVERPSPHRSKREVVTALTIGTLFSLGIAGAGTGVAALVTREKGLTDLRLAVDRDLEQLRQSISGLEQSLTSLSELVLQNRRGLDLLVLKEGGLCAALKEECCFYVDKIGAVRDSLAKLKKDLDRRRKEYESSEGWFESWFKHKPWFATLLSAVVGH